MPRKHVGGDRTRRGYHVHNQGAKVDGRARRVFIDDGDKRFFLSLLARHLGESPRNDGRGRMLAHLRSKLTLLAYNVMLTHFHLIVWQHSAEGVAELMNLVKSAYVRYFNKKYGNSKPLFNGPFQAKPITSRTYFKWLVGYVHDNHPDGVDYEFSSHRAWVDERQCPSWLDPAPGLRVFGGVAEYLHYLQDRKRRSRLNRKLGLSRK